MGRFNLRGMLGAACVAASLSMAPSAALARCHTPPDYDQIKSELIILISVIEDKIDKYPPRSPIARFLRHKLSTSQHFLARLERYTEYRHRYNPRNPHKRHNVRGRICQPPVSKW